MAQHKMFHLKTKSAWKTVKVPETDDFADLIEIQELEDYEFVEKPLVAARSREKQNAQQWTSPEQGHNADSSRKKKRKTLSSTDKGAPQAKKKKVDEIADKPQHTVADANKKKKKRKKKKKTTAKSESVVDAGLAGQTSEVVSVRKDQSTEDYADKGKKKKKRRRSKKNKQKQTNVDQAKGEAVDEMFGSTEELEEEDGNKDVVKMEGNMDNKVENNEEEADSKEESGKKLEDMEEWKGLNLSGELLRALQQEGFTEPTPIQAMALPPAILHRLDIIGAAQTGSGKTLAFGLPILQFILNQWSICNNPEGPVAVILEPTRELAMQVLKHLKSAARFTSIRLMAIVGQMAVEKQHRLLQRKPHIIVATPGRLWELIQAGQDEHLKHLHSVQQFVLDEADRLTETNHFEEVHSIITRLNADKKKKRQHYIFSATLMLDHSKPQRLLTKMHKSDIKDVQQKLQDLVSELGIQGKPKRIDLSRKEGTADTLTEASISCQSTEKDMYLYYLLKKYGGRTLVFCNSKDCIRRLVSVFKLLDCNPMPLHSDMKQPQRLKNLDNFANNSPSLLLATDVAARGLDICGVDHVVHYQVPFTVEKYIHRSGRTARAARVGLSVVLISPEEIKMYRNILKLKEGEELPAFPVDRSAIEILKAHVKLATLVDKEDYRLRKDKVHNNWILRAAKEADLVIDDGLLVGDEDGQRKQQEKNLKQKKQQLAAMLKQPLFSNSFSGRYPTLTGQLVLPQKFSSGSAVTDCSNLKKKKKK